MKRFLVSIFALFIAILPWPAGGEIRLEVDVPNLISKEVTAPLTEPHLIVDPRDPNHFLVAAITVDEPEVRGAPRPPSHITLFQSFDGGATWNHLAFDDGIDFGADPWLAMNDQGVVVLTALTGFADDQSGIFMTAWISRDGGVSWSGPLNLGRAHDRETIAVHPSTQEFVIVSAKGDRNGNGDLRWGISAIRLDRTGVFRRSNYYIPSNADQNTTAPAFTYEGELIVPFIDYMVLGKMLETRRAWVVRSSDMGASFSEPILITEQEWGPAILAIDAREERNRLYYLRTLGGRRAYEGYDLLHSDDLGESWSRPVPVSTPTDGKVDMRNAVMAVNGGGAVAVSWYDRRRDPARNDLYVSVSLDGEKFLEEVRVTHVSADPATEANGWAAERWPAGGDYHGLASLPEGSFQMVWSHSPDGFFRLYTAKARLVTDP